MAGTHLLSGVAAGLVLLPVAPITGDPFEQAAWVAAVGLCALAPDLDHPQSTLGRLLPPVSWLIAWISGGHRAATHSVLDVAVFTGLAQTVTVLAHLPAWVPYAVAVGCVIHVAGDCLTRNGCPLLWPADRKSTRLNSSHVKNSYAV